jgi:hypothetical protein
MVQYAIGNIDTVHQIFLIGIHQQIHFLSRKQTPKPFYIQADHLDAYAITNWGPNDPLVIYLCIVMFDCLPK